MYHDYWGLDRSPFESDGDLDLFVSTPEVDAVLLKLRYLLDRPQAAGALVGSTGVGKTTVLRQLITEFAAATPEGVSVRVVYPRLRPCELLATLAVRLGADPSEVDSTRVGLDRVLAVLQQTLTAATGPVLIAIDDAHTIDDPETWQALRLLTNLRETDGIGFTLLLAGQNELLGRLKQHPELAARVPLRVALPPLCPTSVVKYVQTRLAKSGCQQEPFDAPALAELAASADGIPRRINERADLCLLLGVADRLPMLTAGEVKAASGELDAVLG